MSATDDVHLMKSCRWIDLPVDQYGKEIETWDLAEHLGFKVPRIFWLTNIAKDQWRGRHAHRNSILATIAINGNCRLTLDDPRQKQVVELRDQGPRLIIDPWIWQDLYDFTPNVAELVFASTLLSEDDYIRDYGVFIREATERLRRAHEINRGTTR